MYILGGRYGIGFQNTKKKLQILTENCNKSRNNRYTALHSESFYANKLCIVAVEFNTSTTSILPNASIPH